MYRAGTMIVLALTVGLTGCATNGNMRPATVQQMTQTLGTMGAATEQGAHQDPRAIRQLEIARDRIANAQRLSASGDHAAASREIGLAQRDAEIALAMTRETNQRLAAAAQARAGQPTRVNVTVRQSTKVAELTRRNRELATQNQQLEVRARELEARQAELERQAEAARMEREARERAERERDEAMTKVKEFAAVEETLQGTVITLGGALLFRFNEATLLPTARDKLDQVATALQTLDTDQTLVIEGHADAVGTRDYNRQLSRERADAVRGYLVEKGVSPDKIVTLGKGEEEPVAPNADPEGRANNRRVEIVISPPRSARR